MTIGDWLKQATDKLKSANISNARLDALLLLEYCQKLDRAYLLAHQDWVINSRQLKVLGRLLERRLQQEPIAYIRGYYDFYGRRFIINKNALVPRPESEAFIQLLKKLPPALPGQKLLDIGTGSGILAITAKLEFPILSVWANDISAKALKIANINAKNLGANVIFSNCDLVDASPIKYDYIFANLPYVPLEYKVSPAVNCEPSLALYAGIDGLDLIKRLAPLAYKCIYRDGYIFLESLLEQQALIRTICHKVGFKIIFKSGLVQCFQKP